MNKSLPIMLILHKSLPITFIQTTYILTEKSLPNEIKGYQLNLY